MKNISVGMLKGFLVGIAFMFGVLTMGLLAVTISGTIKTWKSGDRLTSTDLNTTIASLKAAIEGIPVGTYCGQTGSTTGNIGGYAAAKALCATACSNSKAHMCSGHEIDNSLQFSLTIPAVDMWIGAGSFSGGFGGCASAINHCIGWTDATAGNCASIYGFGPPQILGLAGCNSTHPIACCL